MSTSTKISVPSNDACEGKHGNAKGRSWTIML